MARSSLSGENASPLTFDDCVKLNSFISVVDPFCWENILTPPVLLPTARY